MIKRCNKLLLGYEEKLHLVEKFVSLREQVGKIEKLAKEETENLAMIEITSICATILEEL